MYLRRSLRIPAADREFLRKREAQRLLQAKVDQLEYNLPFEFNDYITGERKEYVFDYAVVSDYATPGDEGGAAVGTEGAEEAEAAEPVMELLAVGAKSLPSLLSHP